MRTPQVDWSNVETIVTPDVYTKEGLEGDVLYSDEDLHAVYHSGAKSLRIYGVVDSDLFKMQTLVNVESAEEAKRLLEKYI